MENLIFFSGPQGGGKTTLVNLLSGPGIIVPKLKTRTISMNSEPNIRLALKICQRALENFEYMQIAQTHPNEIVLGNRCIYDQESFNEVYVRRGWLSQKEQKKYDSMARMFYHPKLQKPKAIVLNPGFDVVWRHLEKRWLTEDKKWRENDKDYIKIACDVYEKFREAEDILYINREICLDSSRDTDTIRSWLEEKTGISVVQNLISEDQPTRMAQVKKYCKTIETCSCNAKE